MTDNNKNPRRTIWLSETEPLSHYDIWLSKNQHLNSEGESVSDSRVLRPCDYIFKVWDCDNWYPIIGFNATAANKIDTVSGMSYHYTINGNQFTSEGKQEFDLPLFTNESPSELFSAGPLGGALNKFVTDELWETIYDSHLKTIIESYPFDLWPAEPNELGGVFADRFTSSYNDTSVTNKTWMAQCKYKYNASNNYNLYVHAKDIISAINTYYEDNPGGSVLPIDPLLLTIILEALLKNTSSIGWSILHTSSNPTVSPEIYGINNAAAGKFLRIKDPFPPVPDSGWNLANCAVEWVDISDYLGIEGGVATELVNSKVNLRYSSENFSVINPENKLTLKPATTSSLGGIIVGTGLHIDNTGLLTVELQSSQEPNITAGTGIEITGTTEKTISIDTSDATAGQVLSYDGDGDVEWVNLPSLVEGNGINTFVIQNKIYVKSYTCIIQEGTFTLDPDMSVSSNIPYSNSRYPFVDFTDYLCSNAVSSITIDSNGTPYLQYPSYMNFTTSTKCTFTFPKTMEFVETKSVNSSTGEDYCYTDTNYIIELQPETKYNVIFYKSCIKFETNSNSIFDTEFNPGT